MSIRRKSLVWIKSALTTQILVTICTLPFIAYWGLGFSLISIAGNIIHGLFLTPFLLLSSFFFFLTVLGAPLHTISSLLSMAENLWSFLLDQGSASLVIGVTPETAVILFITLASILVCLFFSRRIGLFFLILLLLYAMNFMNAKEITILENEHGSITFMPRKNKLVLMDDGFISRINNTENLVRYTIMPHIRKNYGGKPNIVLHSTRAGKRIQHAQSLLS